MWRISYFGSFSSFEILPIVCLTFHAWKPIPVEFDTADDFQQIFCYQYHGFIPDDSIPNFANGIRICKEDTFDAEFVCNDMKSKNHWHHTKYIILSVRFQHLSYLIIGKHHKLGGTRVGLMHARVSCICV